MNNKAVILARVSSKEQEEEEGYSVDSQAKYLKAYCANNNLKVERVFKIAETASKDSERTGFNEVIEFTKREDIPNLVIEKVDRATRNTQSTLRIDDWLNEDSDRRLHLPKSGLVLHKNSSSQDKFMWDIHVAVAKQYINNLREEVKKGVKEKLEQGWYPGSNPPIGYKHSGDKGRKTQIIDQDTSPLVKLAFELYDTGNYSIKTLAAEMKDHGLLSKHERTLSRSYLHSMLRNKFYVGIMNWMGTEYPGNFDTFIDRDLFDRVQNRLTRADVPRVEKHITLLKGKIRCAVCSATISWYQQKGHWYGECKSNRLCTARGTARQDRIEKELADYFNQLIAPSPAIIAWVKKELRESHHQEDEQHKAAVRQLSRQFERLNLQISTLYEDRLDGRISAEIYDRKVQEKTAERDEVARKLESLSSQNTEYIAKGIDILETTQNAAEIFKNKSLNEKRILLGDIFSNITLNGKHMEITWRPESAVVRDCAEKTKRLEKILEPSDDLSKMGLSDACRSEWLRGRDSNSRPIG